jgi:hypothetical protein
MAVLNPARPQAGTYRWGYRKIQLSLKRGFLFDKPGLNRGYRKIQLSLKPGQTAGGVFQSIEDEYSGKAIAGIMWKE